MDYIRELNAFRDWTLLNRPSAGQIALWYSLMSVNNMTGWTTSFVVANSTLELMTGLSKGGLEKARTQLINKGLIKYETGTTRKAGKYKLVPFVNQKVGQSEANQGTNQRLIGSQSEAKQGDIIKLNETKRKENSNPHNPPKQKVEKKPYAEFVFLTPEEHERLIDKYGEDDTFRMIEILDNYIGQNPEKHVKRYTDHNRVLQGWVKDRLVEEKAKQPRANKNKADLVDQYFGVEGIDSG